MSTMADTSFSRYNRSRLLSPASRMVGDMATSTETIIPAILKRPHNNSAMSFEQKLPQHTPNAEENFEKFSTSLLKNKTLLVPRRLALKRQQTSFKPPKKNLEPVYSDTLQMELGNPEEFTIHNDRDDDEPNTIITQNTHLSPEQNRTQSTSNNTSLLRGDTPHTAPTDISLLYRYAKTNYRLNFCFSFKHKCRHFEKYVLYPLKS